MTSNGNTPEAKPVHDLWAVIVDGDDGESVAAMPIGPDSYMPLVSNALAPLLEVDFPHMARDVEGTVSLRHFKMHHDEDTWTAEGEPTGQTGTRRMRWGTEADLADPETNMDDLAAMVERTGLLEQIADSPFVVQVWNRGPDERPTSISTRFAVELGAAILFDRPFVVAIEAGMHLPDSVRRLAAEVVVLEHDPDSVAGLVELQDRLAPFVKQYGAGNEGGA
jgi:hypothetical protein